VASRSVIAILAAALAASPASAACKMELAVYGDRDGAAEVDFTPTAGSATVTNSFRMILGKDAVLDGFVMWTSDVERPFGQLGYRCPDGDTTGEQIAACTVWQGIVYAVDGKGGIGLLPQEGGDAPPALLFPDLGPSVKAAPALAGARPATIPWDVFTLKGCQE
jgi:hypothetical protein